MGQERIAELDKGEKKTGCQGEELRERKWKEGETLPSFNVNGLKSTFLFESTKMFFSTLF